MAAITPPEPRVLSLVQRFQLVRELGSRIVPTWAALELLPDGRTQLVVAERISLGGPYADGEIADWVRDARRLATLEHPNVARVRDVVIRGQDVLVINDFVDGVRLSDLLTSTAHPAHLEVTLRVLVDVLSGLSAIHNLRDAKRQPLKLVHGELTPECVLVGVDGLARVVGAHRARAAKANPEDAPSGYLAPEVLLADEAADARADIHSVGVMLWEALSGRSLFANTRPSAIVTQILSDRVPRATIPPTSPWAAPLAEAAARALSADPHKRFGAAAAFAAELRGIAGPRLAAPIEVGAFVRAIYGNQIRARREALDRGETARRQPLPTPAAPPRRSAGATPPAFAALPPPRPPPRRAAAASPPPQSSPLIVPAAPRVPKDMRVVTTEAPVQPREVASRRARRRGIALVVGPAALLLIVIVGWLALRSPDVAQGAAPSTAGD
jgi:hypothetical protein